jgi:5,5'-dehydrodivanillate O-demethylase
MQIRVPIDDTRTRFYLYSCYRPAKGVTVPSQQRPPVYQVPFMQPNGKFATDWVTGQDVMVMVTQGPILDRTDEKLGASDEGVIFYRKVLSEQIDRVQRGEDPLGVIRDPARYQIIELKPGERATRVGFMDNHWHQFSPIYAKARALILQGVDQSKAAGENT